ncbi:ABC transporter substrate-binding protein [Brevibacillus sp. B_LB10_24]|uniref:ABC transporter substrate-binding protein n=1 Tax=Brevibacillus sp. B_LB10_24 TaxID=3380645 RepID=UPI0038B851AE
MVVKRVHALLVFMTALLLLAGCSSPAKSDSTDPKTSSSSATSSVTSGPQKGGELTVAYDSDLSNYDPILGNSGSDHALLYPVYDTLVTYNSNLEPQPCLAESWEIVDDKTIVLHLRKGVTFHDGTPFDAEAVKFNLERANSAESKVSDLKNIKSVEVVDPSTVKLHLEQPDSSIILSLADRTGMMASPTAIQKYGADYSQNPVGTGPFKMVKWVRNGEIQFVANADYWQKGYPYLDKITVKIMPDENARLNALKSGQVQIYWNVSPSNVQALTSDPNLVIDSKVSLAFYNIYINTTIPPFDKAEVRHAMQYAIDREALVKTFTFGQGEPAYQSYPSGYWAHQEGLKIPYDPEKAKQLLKQAGAENVSFDMTTPPTAFYQRIAEAVRGQLKEVGITVNIKPMELTKGTALYFNEKQIAANLTRWTGRPDPQQTAQLFYSGKGFYNAGGATVPEKEQLITQAAASYDQKERAKLYGEINQIALLDEAMQIPIMYSPIAAALSPKVKGFESTLLGKPRIQFLWLEK